jgi:hypothetical protein
MPDIERPSLKIGKHLKVTSPPDMVSQRKKSRTHFLGPELSKERMYLTSLTGLRI